jgi:hypothetical protein
MYDIEGFIPKYTFKWSKEAYTDPDTNHQYDAVRTKNTQLYQSVQNQTYVSEDGKPVSRSIQHTDVFVTGETRGEAYVTSDAFVNRGSVVTDLYKLVGKYVMFNEEGNIMNSRTRYIYQRI